jgi:hypothetical protein
LSGCLWVLRGPADKLAKRLKVKRKPPSKGTASPLGVGLIWPLGYWSTLTKGSSLATKKATTSPSIPKPGEQWEFKFNRKAGPFDSGQNYPPATVLDVAEGWVRYAIGKSHPDLKKPLATFTYMYTRGF